MVGGEKNKLARWSDRYERNAKMVGNGVKAKVQEAKMSAFFSPTHSGQMDRADPRYSASEPTSLSFLLSFITSSLREVSARGFLH